MTTGTRETEHQELSATIRHVWALETQLRAAVAAHDEALVQRLIANIKQISLMPYQDDDQERIDLITGKLVTVYVVTPKDEPGQVFLTPQEALDNITFWLQENTYEGCFQGDVTITFKAYNMTAEDVAALPDDE